MKVPEKQLMRLETLLDLKKYDSMQIKQHDMNKIKRVILIIMLIIPGFAFPQWINIAQPGQDIFITSETNGFVFENFWGPPYAPDHSGMYKISKTIDSWQSLSLVEQYTGYNLGCCSLKDFFFVNDSIGFKAVNDQGNSSISITTDAGNTWNGFAPGGSSFGFSMFFLNKNIGYCSHCPGSRNSSYVSFFHNGTISNVYSSTKYQFRDRDMYFINDSTGFIL